MKTLKQIQAEYEEGMRNVSLVRSIEIGIQSIFFISKMDPTVMPPGKVDRARAIVDAYLNQFQWDGIKLVSYDARKNN